MLVSLLDQQEDLVFLQKPVRYLGWPVANYFWLAYCKLLLAGFPLHQSNCNWSRMKPQIMDAYLQSQKQINSCLPAVIKVVQSTAFLSSHKHSVILPHPSSHKKTLIKILLCTSTKVGEHITLALNALKWVLLYYCTVFFAVLTLTLTYM